MAEKEQKKVEYMEFLLRQFSTGKFELNGKDVVQFYNAMTWLANEMERAKTPIPKKVSEPAAKLEKPKKKAKKSVSK